jgi:hypothetical protein
LTWPPLRATWERPLRRLGWAMTLLAIALIAPTSDPPSTPWIAVNRSAQAMGGLNDGGGTEGGGVHGSRTGSPAPVLIAARGSGSASESAVRSRS